MNRDLVTLMESFGMGCIHCIASLIKDNGNLRIDFTFSNGTKSYLFYDKFAVGPANNQYKLSISGFSGITTDPFRTYSLDGMKFTTKDRDNDLSSSRNCAIAAGAGRDGGGWWYRNCAHIHINQQYTSIKINLNGKLHHSISFTEMKIRPHSCAN